MTDDWKAVHAGESEKAAYHPLVQGVIEEMMRNLHTDNPWVHYGLLKVATYAAQVARAQALGFDPELLRLTPDEANSALMRLAAEAVFRGVPTHVIGEADVEYER